MSPLESGHSAVGPIVVLALLGVWFVGWLIYRSMGGGQPPRSTGSGGPVGTAGTAPFMGPGPDGKWVEQQRPREPIKNAGLVGAYINAKNEIAEQHAQIICPHCQTKGSVTARQVKRRRRLSVTRVVTATATMGASLPIAGTSKKNTVTELSCSNCNLSWDI